jgi:hypothetical protein
MKVTESIDNVLVPKVNDFNNNFNNIFNLINARERNELYQYNRNLETNFNFINTNPISDVYYLTLCRGIAEGDSIGFITDDLSIEVIFTKTITTQYEYSEPQLKIRIDKNFISTKENFKAGIDYLYNTVLIKEYSIQKEYNTFNTSTFIFVSKFDVEIQNVSSTLNSGLILSTSVYTGINDYPIETMDYNNLIKRNNNGVGFIRCREHTPVVTTMLNSFPNSNYRINLENQKRIEMIYIGNGITFNYLSTNENTVMSGSTSEDYNFLIQDSFSSNNVLNVRLINTVSNTPFKYFLNYIQNINCENYYDKKVFTLGWRNKFGTIGFISTTSRPVINISRNVSLNSTNKQYSTNSFINSPNTSTPLNRLIKREISSYDSNISFSLSFPFNNDTKEIMYDIVDSNYFILYEKSERTFSLNIESYSIENNILNLNLIYLDDEYTDKLLSILNEF